MPRSSLGKRQYHRRIMSRILVTMFIQGFSSLDTACVGAVGRQGTLYLTGGDWVRYARRDDTSVCFNRVTGASPRNGLVGHDPVTFSGTSGPNSPAMLRLRHNSGRNRSWKEPVLPLKDGNAKSYTQSRAGQSASGLDYCAGSHFCMPV
jgi:hypothetical protein